MELLTNPEEYPEMVNLMTGLDKALAIAKIRYRHELNTDTPETDEEKPETDERVAATSGKFGQPVASTKNVL
jgi:hypothetical protein